MSPEPTTAGALIDRFEAVLLDAYGVLVDGEGALPHAAAFVDALTARDRRWLVVTNDASRSPAASAARYRRLGLAVPDDRVLTSGMLLSADFAAHGLEGAETLVLGTEDTFAYVRDAGGIPVGPEAVELDRTRALVVGDLDGYPLQRGMDAALSLCLHRVGRGAPLDLVLPNPDLVYPQSPGRFGFAAGSLAEALERALDLRHPGEGPRFRRLGKPHPAVFEAAMARLGTRDAVMIGDQLVTDVAGARRAGLTAALLAEGVGGKSTSPDLTPHFHLASLRV